MFVHKNLNKILLIIRRTDGFLHISLLQMLFSGLIIQELPQYIATFHKT